MKKLVFLLIISVSLLCIISCSKDDAPPPPLVVDKTDPDPEPENQAPGPFTILEVKDKDTATTLTPTFRWNTSTDPDGDMVAYDLLIGKDESALETVVTDLNTANYDLEDRLSLFTEYFWKVKAKDSEGLETSTETLSFVTRRLNHPEAASISDAGFLPRNLHTVTEFNGKLWLFGGQNQDGVLGDVWSSDDGVLWSGGEDSKFANIRGHAAVAFKDTLWLLGGRFGTSSTTRAPIVFPASENKKLDALLHFNAQWPERELHTAAVFKDKAWVLGGVDNTNSLLNDVWSTTDMENWQLETNAPWSGRFGHSTVVFQDKLWVIGGRDDTGVLSDVWSSEDGVNWIRVSEAAGFRERLSHASVVYDDKIWVFGGEHLTSSISDIWYTENGEDWVRYAYEGNFGRRSKPSLNVFNDQMFLIGGGHSGTDYFNDIWVFD